MRRVAVHAVIVGLLGLAFLLGPERAARAQEAINLRHTVTVDVVEKTKDAVVNISAVKLVPRRVSPFGDDPFWQGFEMPGNVVKVPANSLGSGFLVHPDGYVVTNNHVIDRARQVVVEMNDGRKLPAELISADPQVDVAILKVSSDKPLPSIQLGDSSDLMIGEPVIAVGNPYGFSHSVSTGIVSALHRDLKDQQGNVMLGDLVQTDAAINPGNSGGPLLNAYGQVIGINTAIRGDAQNIGFAIQVNRLRELIPELMNPAAVTKIDVPVKLSERRKVTPPANVAVELIDADGNRVAKINGVAVRDVVDAYAQLLKVKPGDKSITLADAAGAERKVSVAAVPLPDAVVRAKELFGVTIEQLTPMSAERYRVQTDNGLIITAVTNGTPAAAAGLRPGDVIIQLGPYRVNSLDDLGALLQRFPDSGRVRVGVVRRDVVGFAVVEF
jgi:serine protease Do